MTNLTRRSLLAGGLAAFSAAGLPPQLAPSAAAAPSLRALFHLTPTSGWLCDPQRPIHAGGKYHLYYLKSDQNNAPGWWQHATTTDGVTFTDAGVAIPLGPNFPAWTGSLVVDENNTAGFGAGTIVALATRPTGGDRFDQEQYLYYSHDGGYTFTAYGAPVIDNPDHSDWFRDPKIHWDSAHHRWAAVIGRFQSAVFYTSTDLVHWTYRSTFTYTTPNIGGFECPDLFEMEADDGTWHWILGASMQGNYSGKPDTYAYWPGYFDGTTYHPDSRDPQWLDWGFDYYAAVTWPSQDAPRTKRFAIAWMNNWQYAARSVPTDASDGYNGQMSVVRQLTLARQPGGWCTLLSQPISSLADHAWRRVTIPDQTVNGSTVLPYTGRAYQLQLDVSWSAAANVGLSVGRSPDGGRRTNIGVFQGSVYVDRRASEQSAYSFGSFGQCTAPIDPAARHVRFRALVDRQSVEVFVNAGFTVLSNQVYFGPDDTGVSLYTDGGPATFTGITVDEIR